MKDTVLYDEVMVAQKYQGLTPKQLIDYRALRGDPTDNIPGVPGIGEKTATALIKEYASLEKIYDNLPLIQTKIGEKLTQHKDQAFFSRELAQIYQEVPIDFNLKDCQWSNYNKEKASEVLNKLDFYSLIPRLP